MKKKSNFLGTAVAALFVTGLAGYAYFVEYKQRNQTEIQKEKDALVLGLEKDKLTRLELHRSSGPLVMEAGAGSWKITEPIKDTVDKAQFDSLVDALLSEKSAETVVEGDSIDWKTYGLDLPVTRLVAKAGDTSKEIKIGSVKSFDGQLYARIGDEKRVLLVNQSWDAHLSKPVTDLRDKRVFRGEKADFDSIQITRSGGGKLHLKKKEGKWTFAAGGDNSMPISAERVKSYIDRIQAMRADDVVAEDKAGQEASKFGLNGRVLTAVEMTNEKGAAFQLTVSTVKPGEVDKTQTADNEAFRFAKSSDAPGVLKLLRASVDDIDKGPDAFYDSKFPFRLAKEDVAGIEVKSGATEVKAKLENGTWTLAQTDAKNELDSAKVQDLLERLSRFEATRFKGKAPGKGLSPNDRYVRLADAKGETLLRLNWGEEYVEKEAGSETRLIDVKTSLAEQTFAVHAFNLTDLPLKELVKSKAASSPTQSQNSTPLQGVGPGSATAKASGGETSKPN